MKETALEIYLKNPNLCLNCGSEILPKKGKDFQMLKERSFVVNLALQVATIKLEI